MPAPGHPPVNPTRVTGFRHDGKGGAISRAGEGGGDRLFLGEAGDPSSRAGGWVVWVACPAEEGALLELWDEGGAHSAFESALGGFVFGLDLLGRFTFVGVLGRFLGR